MSRFTTSDGLSLAYEDEGEGLPVLCLPGLTRSARDFDDLAAVLPPGIRLLRLTLRGRGASDWAKDFRDYAVPVEARDVVELLDHLGLPKVAIVGTSRGGMIAMLMAALVKDRLSGVLLNDIGPEIDPAGLARIMTYVGKRPVARDYDELAQALHVSYQAEFPNVPRDRWRVLAERWFTEEDDGIGLRYDPAIRDAMTATDAAAPPDLWPLFDVLAGLPLAVVRGANSDILSHATLTAMQARRPDMIVAEVPDRGHVPFLDEPESLAALGALLERIRT